MKKILFITLILLLNVQLNAQIKTVKLIKKVNGKKVTQTYECYMGIHSNPHSPELSGKKVEEFVKGLECPGLAVKIDETIE